MNAPISLDAVAADGARAPLAQAGYGVSLTDVAAFESALARAHAAGGQGLSVAPVRVEGTPPAPPAGATAQALARPLDQIDAQATGLSELARAAIAEGRALTPSEMVMLTMKCQEFMFHCQLTSNVANRTSDGLQQLFRQQA